MFRSQQKGGLLLAAGLTFLAGSLVNAQETAQNTATNGQVVEEVIITGTRREIQNTIELKRNATQIVDGLSSADIGDIPALSIGDALETITGATSHRENGGASEISVRGLGPFLGTTVINGREATNGGGNRAVNFSIFPSELFNKVAIHKTQSAEYIEGAVSGQIHLDTKRPLDYGKRLAQLKLKGAYSPDESNINGGQEFGSRGTAAFIDQFEFENGGALGVSLGIQLRDETNPEAEYHTTSGSPRLEACELASFDSDALPIYPDSNQSRCMASNPGHLSNGNLQNVIDANPNYNSVADIPFAYIPRDHRYRQNTTDDEREAFFGSLQWQPNDRLDIMLDFQYSERDQREMRKDLQFNSTQEGITALSSDPSKGIVYSSTSTTEIISYTTDFQRLEEYAGFGLNVNYQISDEVELSLDYARSDTTRTETDTELTLGATPSNLMTGGSEDFIVQLDVNQGAGAGLATILDDGGNGFEVTDPSYFNSTNRARVRAREIIRENTLDAFRADLTWTPDSGLVSAVKTGARVSRLEYLTLGNGSRSTNGEDEFEIGDLLTENGAVDSIDEILANVLACADQRFPESNFLSNVRDGDLITNAVSGSSVSSYATFDFDCAANALLVNHGGVSGIQQAGGIPNGITSGTNDVTEDTVAFYFQADFDSEIGDIPVRGNFGTRVVHTDIASVGYRRPITVEETDDRGFFVSEDSAGTLETDTAQSGYTELLPSVTLVADLSDELMLRAGAFRGMSRPDPNAYGNGRQVYENEGDSVGYLSLAEAVNSISAAGNPFLKPIMSTNLDLGLEWYPNEDTILGAALYWKQFNGAFENVAQLETFNVDGNRVQGLVETTQISDDSSVLKGIELTATHAFTYLPGFLGGFGGKLSYNYADSDFEYEDQHGGDGTTVTVDKTTGAITETALLGILEPANLFGLSKHVASAQFYWENDDFNIQALYKYRSHYFQQYTRDIYGRVRYTDDNETLDLRARYRVNSNLKVSLEVKNLLDEPRIDYRGVDGNILQALSYGPRVFIGAEMKF